MRQQGAGLWLRRQALSDVLPERAEPLGALSPWFWWVSGQGKSQRTAKNNGNFRRNAKNQCSESRRRRSPLDSSVNSPFHVPVPRLTHSFAHRKTRLLEYRGIWGSLIRGPDSSFVPVLLIFSTNLESTALRSAAHRGGQSRPLDSSVIAACSAPPDRQPSSQPSTAL